jgi:hypothetical protein
MRFLATGREPLDVMAVERPHEADLRQHRRTATGDQHQSSHGVLPLRCLVLGFRKFGDVIADVLERYKLSAAGQVDGIVELAGSVACCHQAISACAARI